MYTLPETPRSCCLLRYLCSDNLSRFGVRGRVFLLNLLLARWLHLIGMLGLGLR